MRCINLNINQFFLYFKLAGTSTKKISTTCLLYVQDTKNEKYQW